MAKRKKSLNTIFRGKAYVGVTNRFAGRCYSCGRDLAPGQGWASRGPGESKWSLLCKNGCKDIPLVDHQHDKWYTPQHEGDIDMDYHGGQ